MTKKIGFVLVLATAVAGGVFALDFKAYPDSLKKGSVIINAGVGFGTPMYGDLIIPPITVSLDYALPLGGLPFTLGALGGLTTSGIESGSGDYKSTTTYTGIAIAGRFGYHPNLGVKNLDAYLNLALGYYIYTGKSEVKMGSTTAKSESDFSIFYYGFNLGARYFFAKNVGIFAELGYSALSYVTAGLTLKF